MKTRTYKILTLAAAGSVLSALGSAQAAMTLLPTSSCSHTGNLVTNGSYENGSPGTGPSNQRYWATGTSLTPFGLPPGWSSSGSPGTYASWGSDGGPPRLRGSDLLPDGLVAMYFGNGAGATTSMPPNFQADGRVTFSGTPTMTPATPLPAKLWQSVPTDTNLAPGYCFSFWASGEFAQNGINGPDDGIFGLRVTNVLSGDPMQFFTVPGGNGLLGMSHRYHFDLVPLNPLAPIIVEFYNWGHFDLTPWGGSGFTTELVMDDVMVNMTPEPASVGLLLLGFPLIGRRMVRRRAVR